MRVVVVVVAAQKLPAARAVFNKLPSDSIDVMMRNWQSEVRSIHFVATNLHLHVDIPVHIHVSFC